MNKTLEERIDDQLDRLENPSLTERELELVKQKIAYLQSLRE